MMPFMKEGLMLSRRSRVGEDRTNGSFAAVQEAKSEARIVKTANIFSTTQDAVGDSFEDQLF